MEGNTGVKEWKDRGPYLGMGGWRSEQHNGRQVGIGRAIQAGNEPKSEWTKACVCVSNKRE